MRWRKLFWLSCLTIILITSGCAPVAVKKEAAESDIEKRRDQARLQLEIAEEALRKGNIAEAMNRYEDVLKTVSWGEEAFLSHLRRGEIYITREQYDEAISELKLIPRRFEKDPIYYDALYSLALSYSRLKEYDLSERFLQESRKGKITKLRSLETDILEGDNRVGEKEYSDALTWYLKALERRPEKGLEASIKVKVETIIDERLSIEELEYAREQYGKEYPSGYILYKLGRTYFEENNAEKAMTALDKFVDKYEGHKYYEEGERLLSLIIETGLADRYAIGCILPLTGQYANFGNRLLDAILLASGVFDSRGESPIKLIIEDSKSDDATARRAVTRLVSEEKVIGIIGPLGSSTAMEAAREADDKKVPIIVITYQEGITDMGSYIFRNFITDEMQMKTLVRYSFENLGIKSFAILYPGDSYGKTMMNLFRDEAMKAGGEIMGIKSYDVSQTDFGREIREIAGIKYIERGSRSEKEPFPTIDFDALFIPDSYSRINMIAPQLAFYNVKHIQLLGTGRWNSPKLLERDSEYLDGAIFVDGFFLDSFYPEVREFIDSFYVAFGRKPNWSEALAYDTAKIMVDLIRNGEVRTRADLRDGIGRLKDHPSITGSTSFTETGDVEKSLYLLMVRGKEIVQIH